MKKMALSTWLVLMLILALVSVMAVACGEKETTTTAGPSTTAGPATTGPGGSETTAPASTESTAPSGQVKELVIGADAFLTGPAAAGGMAAKRGWELAAAKINNAGGLKIGNDTYKIKLVVEDDAMSVDQAATVVQKMIQQDGAKFIMGPLVDAFKNVIYPICAEAGVMLADVDTKNASRAIQYDGNTDVSPDKPLHARFHWANDEMIPHLLDYLQEQYPQAKKIAVCGVTEACTVALFDWLGTYLPTRGLERVGQLEQMAPDTADYNPPVQRLLSAKPDAILVAVSTPTTWGFVTKAAREQGFKGPVMCATHLDVEFAARIAGGGVTDMFGAGVCMSDLETLPQEMKDAHAEYQAAGYPAQDEIADVYLVGYNGLWVLLQAIEKAQSVDPQVVFEKYQQMTEPGTFKTLWGEGAYVGGLKSTGINAVLNEPYWINAIGPDGKAKNVKQIFVTVP